MRTMTVAGWICLLACSLLSLMFTTAHGHNGETDTYHVSVGYLFLLKCVFSDGNTNVTWSRAGGHNSSLPSGVEVRDGLLWFVPIQTSHNGTYICEKREEKGLRTMTYGVAVSTGKYPDPSEKSTIIMDAKDSLPCKQREILSLNNTRKIRWVKDGHTINSISVDKNGDVRLPLVLESDDGIYTCLVDISLNGRSYTAARSIRVTVSTGVGVSDLQMLYPQDAEVEVDVGMKAELTCLVYVGTEDDIISMFWLMEDNFIETYPEMNFSWNYTYKSGRLHAESNLSISKVLRQFLNIPITCVIQNSDSQKTGVVMLREADHSELYISVTLCLTASLATVVLMTTYLFFKVDVVLTYRKMLRHFSKKAQDGKLYDAYVSFLHGNTLSSMETATFALQILPEELEKKHGFSLFIRGRDELPGEAVHDVIAATVRQCHRLIIILSPEAKSSSTDTETQEMLPLCDNESQMYYEQKIGIHDALSQNDPRVILVEIDGPVDYSRLPESLHYIKRKQGVLKWKKDSPGSQKPIRFNSNRKFWKMLRYHMPPVPTQRAQTFV